MLNEEKFCPTVYAKMSGTEHRQDHKKIYSVTSSVTVCQYQASCSRDVRCYNSKSFSWCISFMNSFIHQWLYSPLLGPGLFFSSVTFYTVSRTPWASDQPVARSLPKHRTTQTQKRRTQTSIHWEGFEPTILVFERVKKVHALDRVAIAIRP
jgi:hypothetical protein